MTRMLILFCVIALVSCKHGRHQQVQLKNVSEETVYFVTSADSILSNPNDINRIRPVTFESDLSSIGDTALKRRDQDRIEQNLYRYRVERGDSAIILSSESAEIFVDAISIRSIIRNRYSGRLNIFIVKERDLSEYSDEVIIKQGLYKYVTTLTEQNVTDDLITIQYF